MSPHVWLDRLDAMSPALIDAALRGAVVLVIALVLTHLLRRRSAAMRHLVWVGAVVVQLLLPLFAIWGPTWDVGIPHAIGQFLPVEQQVAGPSLHSGRQVEAEEKAGPSLRSGRQENVVPTGAQRPRDLLVPPAPTPVSGKQLLLIIWALGAIVVLARLAIGTSIVASLARKGNRIDDGNWLSLAQKLSATLQIDRPLTLLRGSNLGVPVTWGIVYPVVLLPDDADAWPEERRRFVLVHEMAHVKRLDALTQLAGQFALALFWFNPLVWVANRRMQMEREHACDDYVLRHGTQASMYAEELLTMVRSLGSPSHASAQPAFAALAMARRSEFEGRMLSILDPVLDRHPLSKGRTLLSAAAALLLVVPIAALHPYRRAEAAPTPLKVAAAPQQSTRAAPTAADDLPDSFKVSIIGLIPDTGDIARKLAKQAEQLAADTKKLAAGVNKAAEGTAKLDSGRAQIAASTSASGFRRSRDISRCDAARFGAEGQTSSNIHSHEGDDGTSNVEYTTVNGTRCAHVTLIGKIRYSEIEDDIVDMPFGSHASFRYRTANEDRELVLTRVASGGIQRAYRMNGRATDYDGDAQKWFAAFLPSMLMETGLNVAPRVTRWRMHGGTLNVLKNIATMRTNSARRSHFMALLSVPALSGDELDDIVESASENLKSSSSDMRAVLLRAAPTVKLSRQSMSALERALVGMTSSGDKTAVLQRYGSTDDREVLLLVLRASESVGSSGDRSRLYRTLAPHYLGKEDRELTAAFFNRVKQLPSSGDMRNTLMVALRDASKSPVMMGQLINATRAIASSSDLSAVLISVASSGGVTKELHDDFYAAVATIASNSDRARVLQVAANELK